ncbi:MAG: PstS family phosphate ABC transporter substrate-binding protein [Pirellulales bacterium]
MRRCRIACAVVALGLLVVAGCERTQTTIRVDGSSTVYPITEAIAEEFRNERPDVRSVIGFSGTGGGFKKLSAGEIDICDASRTIKDEEKAACEAHGVKYVELEIAFDGLSVVVNPDNDWCDCLTVDQLKAIWQPESAISKWSDLNPEWPDEKIELFGPGTDSGTFDYFTEAIVGEAKSSRADYTPSEDDNMLVTGVEGSKYSLGYFGYAYYVENKDRLKLLGVDAGDGQCVQPSLETVRSNTYKPLSRPLYIYVNQASLAKPEIVEFVKYYLTTVGELVTQVGYVPLADEVAAKSNKTLEDALAATKAE